MKTTGPNQRLQTNTSVLPVQRSRDSGSVCLTRDVGQNPMNSPSKLVEAVLKSDTVKASECLRAGASPNAEWRMPLIGHAALSMNTEMFRLLVEHGAIVPLNFLSEIISWELYDYQIGTDEEEDSFLEILHLIQQTPAWGTIQERELLAQRLDGNLPRITAALLKI